MMDDNEFADAIRSIHIFLLTYNRKNKETIQVFDDWREASGFIFRNKETMEQVLNNLPDLVNCPFDSLLVAAESELIPDYRDYLKYDRKGLF